MANHTTRIFLSYRFDKPQTDPVTVNDRKGAQLALILTPEQFIHRVKYYLSKQANLEPFCYVGEKGRLDWDDIVKNQLSTSNKLVLFLSGTMGHAQSKELGYWKEIEPDFIEHTVAVEFPVRDGPAQQHNLGRRVVISNLYNDLLGDMPRLPRNIVSLDEFHREKYTRYVSNLLASKCAECIFTELGFLPEEWIPCDGLPVGYPFDYEKGIIEEFVAGKGQLLNPKRLQQGCPLEWPEVARVEMEREEKRPYRNPIPELITGRPRLDTDTIIVDGRSQYHKGGQLPDGCCLMRPPRPLSFPEAGPRKEIVHPLNDDLRIGIVVSGGIAPGINAVIAGICQRHVKYQEEYRKEYEKWRKYEEREKPGEQGGEQTTPRDMARPYRLTVVMYRDGLFGVLHNNKIELRPSQAVTHVNAHANLGGSWISTARHDELLDSNDRANRNKKIDELVDKLDDQEIDILYVIGGEGTMRAAHVIATRAKQRWLSKRTNRQISVVGVPKTMDNDILWVWQAFGFLSAVEKAKEFISQLATEAKSNPRLCIVQLFGSDSGFVVSHAGLASGVCKAALIPEVEFTMDALFRYISEQLIADYEARYEEDRLGQSPYGIILLAETAIPSDVENYIDNPDYSELQLTEKEKEAIRKYIGSALNGTSIRPMLH